MNEKDVIRTEPIECSVRIGEHVTRLIYTFPPFAIVGRVMTDDGDIYAIEWKTAKQPAFETSANPGKRPPA